MAIEDFKETHPPFLPETFFVGQLEGWAVLESFVRWLTKTCHDHGPRRIRSKHANRSLYRDLYLRRRETDTLRWTIRKIGDGKYNGHENRIQGEATGEQAGCAIGPTRATRRKPMGTLCD
jgi:hypothetical protein